MSVFHCVCVCDKMWNDYRLTWNASEFGGLSHIYLLTSDIWIPDIILVNKSGYLLHTI